MWFGLEPVNRLPHPYLQRNTQSGTKPVLAEIEIAILERSALSRRLQDEAAVRRQVLMVETERNEHRRSIVWQFTSPDTRRKLERLYPVKQPEKNTL